MNETQKSTYKPTSFKLSTSRYDMCMMKTVIFWKRQSCTPLHPGVHFFAVLSNPRIKDFCTAISSRSATPCAPTTRCWSRTTTTECANDPMYGVTNCRKMKAVVTPSQHPSFFSQKMQSRDGLRFLRWIREEGNQTDRTVKRYHSIL